MLLWMEGFDHYGNGTPGLAAMLDGAWAELNNPNPPTLGNLQLDTTIVRTGVHSLKFTHNAATTFANRTRARRTLTAPVKTFGLGFALYMEELPPNSRCQGIRFADGGNITQCILAFASDGAVELLRGPMTTAGSVSLGVSTQALTADAWNHVEVEFTCDNTAGAIEVRVNEVTVLSLTGLDTQTSALDTVAQIEFGYVSTTNTSNVGGSIFYLDDMFTRDTAGTFNADFVGDYRVFTTFPDDDGSEDDWIPSTGTEGWPILDNAPPDPLIYVSTAQVGGRSTFGMTDLPLGVFAIAGVQGTPYVRKSDAGPGSLAVQIKTPTSETAIADRPMTTEPTYWTYISEFDPDTGQAWTPGNYADTEMLLERTL